MITVEAVKEAIEKAKRFESKLSEAALAVPMMGSLKIRHLLNNLGAISTSTLDVGIHKGGSTCSIIYGNDNIKTHISIDNYSEFSEDGEAKACAVKNIAQFKPESVQFELIEKDAFTCHLGDKKIDLYLYDGSHGQNEQRKAVTHFMESMADEFIFCCDDYDWEQVYKGTREGLAESGLEILFEEHLKNIGDKPNESFWNGFFVALLKKPVNA